MGRVDTLSLIPEETRPCRARNGLLHTDAQLHRLLDRWLGTMTTVISSVLFGSIGVGYFIYGKKQQRLIPLIAGIGLCAFPYFIPNAYAMVIVGTILAAAPWLLRE